MNANPKNRPIAPQEPKPAEPAKSRYSSAKREKNAKAILEQWAPVLSRLAK